MQFLRHWVWSENSGKEQEKNMSNLEKAIIIATTAHQEQVDKAGEPYILHPLRVMLALQTEAERITAVLHDVIEDTHYTIQDLREEGFPEKVLEALELVTKKENEDYDTFIKRLSGNEIARKVKIADLNDNMNISRIKNPSEKDFARIEKYKKALKELI